MKKIIYLTTTLLFIVLPTTVLAQSNQYKKQEGLIQYKWVGPEKETVYSDTLNNLAIREGYTVIENGIEIKHVPPPITKADLLKQEEIAQEQSITISRQKQEENILNAFVNEDSYKDYLNSNIDNLQQNINTVNLNLKSRQLILSNDLNLMSGYEHNGKKAPAYLVKQINETRSEIQKMQNEKEQDTNEILIAKKENEKKIKKYEKIKLTQNKPKQDESAQNNTKN